MIDRLTREQAAIVGAFTGILAGPFEDLQNYAETILDRPIMSHEFGDKEVWAEIKDAARPDFISICAKE